ncbi:DUF418 domain-containing protein [Lysinibacillus pakistanensis]|uniref:DUF418 domain-containing protein n=1 Tax=Lysinibacillus pakistanensis TaxID=759811 RepID=UPI003D297B4B
MNTSITQKERILSLDIIRGLALFGILFINVEYFLMGLEFVSPKNIVIISILIYSIQIIYSVVWFKFFKMGPLEKVWRFMTYGKRAA